MAPKQTFAKIAEEAQHPHQRSKRMSRSTSHRAQNSLRHHVVEHRKDHEDGEEGEATPGKREGALKHKPRSAR